MAPKTSAPVPPSPVDDPEVLYRRLQQMPPAEAKAWMEAHGEDLSQTTIDFLLKARSDYSGTETDAYFRVLKDQVKYREDLATKAQNEVAAAMAPGGSGQGNPDVNRDGTVSTAEAEAIKATGAPDDLNFPGINGNEAGPTEDSIRAVFQAGWGDAQQMDNAGIVGDFEVKPFVAQRGYTEGQTKQHLSWLGAMDYVYSLSEDDLTKLQDRLVEAGYYDRVGQGPGAIGDRSDKATLAAWQTVLHDAAASGRSLLDEVTSHEASYRAQKAAAYMESLPTVTPETLDLTFDNISQNIIGRNLTTDEKMMVRGYIRKMQQQRSTEVMGDAHPTGGTVDTSLGFATEDVATAVAANIRESTAGTGYALSTALKRVQG